jgi:phospholipid/cholesterol/gamma-HCH transport system substrate-binding protein
VSASPGWVKARRRLGGLAFLLVLVLLAVLSVALYQQRFATVAMVTLYTASAGNEMHPGAEVMVRGVQVGEVRQISADGTGARLELAIQPGELPDLPSNVTAEMLPTTLFGERYVDLILPARPAVTTLAAGSVIRQDQSADGLELERVLNNLLPMLSALQPDKLSLTLTAIAQGLAGRGHELGQTLVTLNAYLRQLNPQLPELDTDIRLLAGLTRTYTQDAPDVLQALSDFGVTGKTIAVQRADFAALLSNVTTASDDLRAFLDANSGNIIRLGPASLPTLAILARYAPEFPCTLRALTQFIPNADRVLGAGTDQPGLHVRVVIVPPPGRYLPKADAPVYGDNLGPHCYPVPFPGIRLNDGTGRATAGPKPRRHHSAGPKTRTGTKNGSAAAGQAGQAGQPGQAGQAAAATAWQAGSPAESELVRELTGLSLGRPPGSLPSWAGLLTAPLFRGTEVIVG